MTYVIDCNDICFPDDWLNSTVQKEFYISNFIENISKFEIYIIFQN